MKEKYEAIWAQMSDLARQAAYAARADHAYLPQTYEEAWEWRAHDWVINAMAAAVRADRMFEGRAPEQAAPTEPKPDDQEIMFMVYDYARISDGIDRAEGEERRQQRAAMLAKANEIRAALAAHPQGAADRSAEAREAARYRWLRARPLDDDEIYIAVDSVNHVGRWALGGDDPDGCDAAIDAAMGTPAAAEPGKGEGK